MLQAATTRLQDVLQGVTLQDPAHRHTAMEHLLHICYTSATHMAPLIKMHVLLLHECIHLSKLYILLYVIMPHSNFLN